MPDAPTGDSDNLSRDHAPLLEVRNLRTHFEGEAGTVKAVDGVSLTVHRGRTLALVGESGSGKSVTSASILRLVPSPPGRIVGGEVRFAGRDLLALPEVQMRRVRGNDIAMIFQEPTASLNPLMTAGEQIAEAVRLHRRVDLPAARRVAVEMLERVGIPDPARRAGEFPHQLSGGMNQRVMIAMALSCQPALLIADEPTTALDVTIQAQILELMRDLQAETGMAMLFVTHDLGVVARIAHDVAVMHDGRVVETGDVETIFASPQHPYTISLFNAILRAGHAGALPAIADCLATHSPAVAPTPTETDTTR